jgi:hypothetical protein
MKTVSHQDFHKGEGTKRGHRNVRRMRRIRRTGCDSFSSNCLFVCHPPVVMSVSPTVTYTSSSVTPRHLDTSSKVIHEKSQSSSTTSKQGPIQICRGRTFMFVIYSPVIFQMCSVSIVIPCSSLDFLGLFCHSFSGFHDVYLFCVYHLPKRHTACLFAAE